jgi:hypothetical protein
MHLARRSGAFTVEINPGATGESHAIDLPIAAPGRGRAPHAGDAGTDGVKSRIPHP